MSAVLFWDKFINWQLIDGQDSFWASYEVKMSKVSVKFSYEKETKNSVRYKEEPEEGKAPIMGTLYVQKWFAGNSKTLEVTIDKKD